MSPTPFEIIETLLPTIKLAGRYASNIQSKIQAQPEKSEYGDNFYATALSDADLTIQTTIELAMLANFPELAFFGEEYQNSYNSKYFSTTSFPDDDQLFITLDPIDGTRAYLDGLSNFSIVLSIIKNRRYEAIFALQPRRGHYFYALRGQGAFIADIDTPLSSAQELKLQANNSNNIYVSFALQNRIGEFAPEFTCWCSAIDYQRTKSVPDYLDFLAGKLGGFVIAKGNLIDSAGFAFLCKEAGAIVSNFNGEDFEPFKQVKDMRIEGIVITPNDSIHEQILAKLT